MSQMGSLFLNMIGRAQLLDLLSPSFGQCFHVIPPEHTRKTFGFLVFSGGIEWEHWPEMS